MEENSIEFENEIFRTHRSGSLAVLEIKDDAFAMMTHVNYGFKLLNWFDLVKTDNLIKGILLFGNPNLFCKAPYEKFLALISNEDIGTSHPPKLKSINVSIRKKQINMLNNYTSSFLKFPKMIITFSTGCIVTPFIGTFLASDIKLAAKQTSFSFLHKKYGLHPTGALPFFFNSYLGLSKTKNILYTKDVLESEELLALGLIDEIINPVSIDVVIEHSKNIVENNPGAFTSTKQLINNNLYDRYVKYMELEEQLIL